MRPSCRSSSRPSRTKARPSPAARSRATSAMSSTTWARAGTISDNGVEEMPITLTPNPSHLEFVDPVVEGRARAAQEQRKERGRAEAGPEGVARDPDPRRRGLSRPGHRPGNAEPVPPARLLGRRHDPHHHQQPDRLYDRAARFALDPVCQRPRQRL